MSLESLVQQRLMRLRMIERALNEPTGWTMRVAGTEVEATVEVTHDAMTFTALVPPMCTVGEDLPIATICKDGEPAYAVNLDGHLGENGTEVSFSLFVDALV